MLITRRAIMVSTAGSLAMFGRASAQTSSVPTDTETLLTLKDFVDVRRRAPGVVVGISDTAGTRILTYGARAAGDARPLNGDTVFEIGSVTKLFTTLTLADMVRTGEVDFEQPVEQLLPRGYPVPSFEQRQIKLIHLANHTSGLPALPSNMKFRGFADPYPYSEHDLARSLADVRLAREPGSKWEYSNVGASLLANALAARSGESFEQLLRARVLAPLRLGRTGISLSRDLRRDLVVGHDAYLRPVGLTQMPGLAGAGMVKSTASDLLTLLQASMLGNWGLVSADARSMLAERRPSIAPGYEQAIGWMVHKTDPGPTIWHDGGSAGCCSFVGFNAQTRRGIVALSNAASNAGIGDLGNRLLSGSALAPITAPVEPRFIGAAASEVKGCLGRYKFRTDGSYLTVSRFGQHIFYQADDKPSYELYPTAPRQFFLKAFGLNLRFSGSGASQADNVEVVQGTATDVALRV